MRTYKCENHETSNANAETDESPQRVLLQIVANPQKNQLITILTKETMTAIASNHSISTQNNHIFSFQSVIRNKTTDQKSLSAYEWLSENEFVQLEGQGTFGFHNFEAANKQFQAIYFTLKGDLAAHYAFFRGIVLAGQPKEVYLENIHENRSFTLKFYKKNEAVAKEYLEKIFRIVNDEIRFKQVLRKVLINQEKHRLEEKLLFNELSH
ncbi:hypothetical protein Echvi_2469 [Echinicola vietnamensis DSM 17526]|uniref:Uncharacterized protein n=2 Tax=Echinicola TaxID=390846 RepID=L0G127_ECHVK|nr:hypothetical protein Echvi_2469 [Echinicola vietnamensis DSM 17526]